MNLIEKYINQYLKAHVSGLGSAIVLLITDLQGGNGHVTANQVYGIIAAYLATGVAVGIAPNSKAAEVVADDVTPVQDDGTED